MKKVLIANRGEIAVRIIETLRKMGIRSVAVYSSADRAAKHVKLADEAYFIGEAPSHASYLNANLIIETAKKAKCEGIHPGYGFLSENAGFAEMVEASGIRFIGPGSEAIRLMGSKIAAKEAVKTYNIPMVPGTDLAIEDPELGLDIAQKTGFPVLIKASAGGGGKGMRIVEHAGEFKEQMSRAISEAKNAFGDGAVFIEKYFTTPRHIEMQILGDQYGNIIHLNERECSVQRRHQKVVEESPSMLLDQEMRQKMGEAAILVARCCNYVGAGTVEFLVDEHKNFYFLEMNTRLQVEHPVTEYITGLDLVEEQIRIARGEVLRYKQEDIPINGHAIELRVYAEDPEEEFVPSTGTLETYIEPQGSYIRVDSGYESGMEVPIYYDPMLAKLITWGKTRIEAINQMKSAIRQYRVFGVKTTLPFGCFVMNHPEFIGGNYNTNFVNKYYSKEKFQHAIEAESRVAALIATKLHLDTVNQVKEPHHDKGNWLVKS